MFMASLSKHEIIHRGSTENIPNVNNWVNFIKNKLK